MHRRSSSGLAGILGSGGVEQMIQGNGERSVTIRLGCMAAYTLWVVTLALLSIGTWVESLSCQVWGLGASAAAATATIRSYFVNTNRLMRTIFELGVDKGRADAMAAATPLRPPVPR